MPSCIFLSFVIIAIISFETRNFRHSTNPLKLNLRNLFNSLNPFPSRSRAKTDSHYGNDTIRSYNETREIAAPHLICHAPFSSINFEQRGNANACCYNRTYILGAYPEQSIEEIWFGKKANKLRKFLAEGDLSHGCQICQKQLESRNFQAVRARHFDQYDVASNNFQSRSKTPMPQCFEFELENTCNLECTMCNGYFSSLIRKNREKLPPIISAYDDAFVDQLVPFLPYLKDAKFLGGEPFLIPVYYKIWEKIAEHNPDIMVHITTNGTVLNQRVKSILNRLNCGIVMSIDSIEKNTYEKIRVNGRFEKVMENFQYFLDYTRKNNTWLTLAVCPITTNWEEMPDLVKFCNERDINIFFNTVFQPVELSLRSKSKEELLAIIERYKQQNLPANTLFEHNNRNCFNDFANQLQEWFRDKEKFHGKIKMKEELCEDALKSILKLSANRYGTNKLYRTIISEFVSGDFLMYRNEADQNYPFDQNFVDPDHYSKVMNMEEPIVFFLYKQVNIGNKEVLLDAIVSYKHFLDNHPPSNSFVNKIAFILDWMSTNPGTEEKVAETAKGTAAKVFKGIDRTPMLLIKEMVKWIEKKT